MSVLLNPMIPTSGPSRLAYVNGALATLHELQYDLRTSLQVQIHVSTLKAELNDEQVRLLNPARKAR